MAKMLNLSPKQFREFRVRRDFTLLLLSLRDFIIVTAGAVHL